MKRPSTNIINFMPLVILCLLVTPITVLAGDFDGSKPLICAIMETFECSPGGECQRGTAMSVDIPHFFRIDFKEKKISGKRKDGQLRTTEIMNMARIEGKLILQGVQEGKAWSLVISESDGMATITVSDNQAGFVIFGACTAP